LLILDGSGLERGFITAAEIGNGTAVHPPQETAAVKIV